MRRNSLQAPFSTRRSRLAGPEAYPLHDHDFGEVFWVDEGECGHEVNGREFVLQTGHCVFIRPWDRHRFYSRTGSEPFWLVNTCFQWSILRELKQRYYGGEGRFYGEDKEFPRLLRLHVAQLERLRQGFIELLKSPKSRFSIDRFLMSMLADLVPPRERVDSRWEQSPSWLREAWTLMRDPRHLHKGVPEFYRLCGRCPEHVSREFRRHSGRTVVASVRQLRMEHAAALLAGTTMEIVEIAAGVGFESLSHFYTCFRQSYRESPGSYRKQAQAGLYENPVATQR